ncbi:MAG: YggU family protein [Deltaproteobacteria bacterium]|nr:YggU family protein [Deltaproteobacteria bacterium]
MPFIEETPKGVFIRVRLQPRSSKNAVEGVQENSLKIKLTAPPVEGEANRALIEFLSDLLGIRKSAFSIDSGTKSREKRVRVEGLGVKEIAERLSGALKEG